MKASAMILSEFENRLRVAA